MTRHLSPCVPQRAQAICAAGAQAGQVGAESPMWRLEELGHMPVEGSASRASVTHTLEGEEDSRTRRDG